jgi:hypothetical protein
MPATPAMTAITAMITDVLLGTGSRETLRS